MTIVDGSGSGSGSWDDGDDAQVLYTCLESTSGAALLALAEYAAAAAEPAPELQAGRRLQLANASNATLGNYSYDDDGNYTERDFAWDGGTTNRSFAAQFTSDKGKPFPDLSIAGMFY